ncbi:6030_t:CDS:2 [Paraglomus brasilianum]|uniref:6030_t:CDS:1 n=1 Tax=Paraglomus brasilianum TaxID=144538 RepID=A0A9N9FJF9_9GLOM|nr:6030_t:CDS:2 [Paraglomus brasilianum]
MKLSGLFVPFLVVATQLALVLADDPENGVALVPGAFGVWSDCSTSPTKYISYALRVIDQPPPGLAPKPNFGKTVKGSNPDPKTSAQLSNVLLTYQMTQKDLNNLLSPDQTADYQIIPSMSCQDKPVRKCDRDTGKDLLNDNVIQCLAVINPTPKDVFMNLSISFTTSVFGPKAFTSPDVNTTGSTTTGGSNSTNLPADSPPSSNTTTPPPASSQSNNAMGRMGRELQGWGVVIAAIIGLIGLVGGI